MSRTLSLLAGVLALAVGTTLAAPPLPLDLVPEDACIGLSIRDLADLKSKSDKLLKDRPGLPRLSQLFEVAYKELRLGWDIDETKASAIVCASGPLAGYAADADPKDKFQIGITLPYKDLDAVAKAWKVKPEDLKKGEPVQVPGREFEPHFAQTWGAVRDGVAFLNGKEAAVVGWMKATSLRQALPQDRVQRLDRADGLIYLGPPLLKVAGDNANPDWVPEGLTEQEAVAYRRANRAMHEARSVLAAFRLDEGLALDLGVNFDRKGKESQALLKAFAGAGRTSTLAGLPEGSALVGAVSVIGVDDMVTEISRIIASEFWLGLRNGSVLLESDTIHLRRLMGDFYAKLKAGRGGLYQGKDKQLTVIGVLEPKDTLALLSDIAAMSRAANEKELDPTANAGKAEIEKLVANLSSDDFDVREAASTKLGLIGPAVLPFLEKAEKSTDAEARRRAGDLRTQIEQVAALRKQEMTKGLLKTAFHPTFSLKLNAEERLGVKVHHLTMHFDAVDAPYATWLKEVFGPDWARIRVASLGEKLVVMIGSNGELFEEGIKNVRDDKPGLEASPALAGFRKQANTGRRAELHVALTRVQALTVPPEKLPKDFKQTSTLTSVALRTGTADLGLDLWLAADTINDTLWWLR
jgi:hypothetical protein